MAAPITHLALEKLPSGPSPITPEQTYWKSFRNQQLIPSPTAYPVTHISYPPHPINPLLPSTNDLFAATTGTRVQIFSIRTRKLFKTITRFSDIAYSGEIRRDGRVMAAGDKTGKIQVFDVNSRAILKTWEEHKQPVWTIKFSPAELTTMMSTSDDRTVRLWDLTSESSTRTFIGHEDYVRSGAFLPAAGPGAGMLVSGAYDGTVRIWDERVAGRAAMVFKHQSPVEEVLPLPSGTTVLAAAGNEISILDLIAGKPLNVLRNHQKTVSSLCLASSGTRVLSGGLDGHVKVFETTAWNVVAGAKYPSPVLSVAVISAGSNREDKHLVVGLQSGVMSIRTRLSGEQKVREKERAKEMQALIDGTLEAYDRKKSKKRPSGIEKKLRGMTFMGEGADIVIAGDTRRHAKKEAPWERDLRQARYSHALDYVLEHNLPPITVLTLLVALRHRSAMRAAFEGRNEATVQPVLAWVTKHVMDPRYVNVCVEAGELLLDCYAEHAGRSESLDAAFVLLHKRVRLEVERCQQAIQTQGMLRLLAPDLAV